MSEPRPSVPAPLGEVTAIVLAGGLGTRLRAAVADRPKPLAWVAGRPFVCHLLEMLEKLGVQQTVLALCHEPAQFTARLGTRFGAMALHYTLETSPLGTGGAIRQALEKVTTPYVLVLNGDSFCEFDFAKLRATHPADDSTLSLVVQTTSARARFGSVLFDAQQRVTGFLEKTDVPAATSGINAGIYYARTDFFRQIEPGRKISIEQELFPGWAKDGRLWAFPTEGRFIDIGLPASYAEAQLFFRPQYSIEIPSMDELRRSNSVVAQMLAARRGDEIKDWKLAVGVIIRDNHGRILLERRADCGLWGLVGGRIDLGETPEQAAKREVKEETGLDIAIERLVGFYSDPHRDVMSYANGDIVQTAALVLEASVAGGEFSPSHESLELAYFEPCAVPRMAIPITLEALDDCLSGRAPALR